MDSRRKENWNSHRMKIAHTPVMRAGKQQPISTVVESSGNLLFVSGQVPMLAGKPAGEDIATQTHAVIDMIAAILGQHDCTLDDIAKTMIWLTDPADYSAFNAAYATRFVTDPPARSTVVAQLIAPVRIEMEAIAVLPARTRPACQAP
jgi:2-iminobutanoate/2-iminopropanoate deaminase